METSSIIVAEKDYEILTSLAKNHQSVDPMVIKCREKLGAELKVADIRKEEDMPTDIVRMGSVITVFTSFGRKVGLKIVLPAFADFQNRKLSIMSPMGTALIGYKEGDKVLWHFPKGDEWITIESVDNTELELIDQEDN